MDKKKLLMLMFITLETLSEVEGSPESMLWLGLQNELVHLDAFQSFLGLLVSTEMVVSSYHYVTITDKGRDLVSKVQAAMAQAKAAL